MSKDQWFKEFEAELSELEDSGIPPDRAYNLAAARTDARLRDALADRIDVARQKKKDEGL